MTRASLKYHQAAVFLSCSDMWNITLFIRPSPDVRNYWTTANTETGEAGGCGAKTFKPSDLGDSLSSILTSCAHATFLQVFLCNVLIFKMARWVQVYDTCREVSVVPRHDECPNATNEKLVFLYLQNFWYQMVISHINKFFKLMTPTVCQQFSYDTNYSAQTPHIKGLVLAWLPPTSDASCKFKVVNCTSDEVG